MTLAYGVFRESGRTRVGARLGDRVLDLERLAGEGQLGSLSPEVFSAAALNPLMALGPSAWRACHARVRELGVGGVPSHPLDAVELLLPFEVADYVDFYSSLHHALNLGRMFRPDADPLLPNWRHLPVGYHGRAGTVVPSGTAIRRPAGQRRLPGGDVPRFGPSVRLDVELELGYVVGSPSELGRPVPVDRALEHVFGVVLVNDWSARDLQAWEHQPLGPFLGKSFATSISHWVVPLEELEPYRMAAEPQKPEPLAYLREEPWAFDLALEVGLNGATVARTNARHLYWSPAQQVAHLTSGGASLRTGDLLATGTISGPEPGARGSLIELSWNAAEPIGLADGSSRTFLEDGDEVVLRGASPDGAVRLGEVRGRIESALPAGEASPSRKPRTRREARPIGEPRPTGEARARGAPRPTGD